MSVLVQDVLVTVVAIGGFGWLIQRVVGLVAPVGKSGAGQGCASCQRCEAPPNRRPQT